MIGHLGVIFKLWDVEMAGSLDPARKFVVFQYQLALFKTLIGN